jgi:hypothetical protein
MTNIGSAEITVDLLESEYQRKRRALTIDLLTLEQPRSIKLDLESSEFDRKRSQILRTVTDASSNTDLAQQTRLYADRNITQAQFEQASFDISQSASARRIAIAKQESADLIRQIEKTRSAGSAPVSVFPSSAQNDLLQQLELNRDVQNRTQLAFNERRAARDKATQEGEPFDTATYITQQKNAIAQIEAAKQRARQLTSQLDTVRSAPASARTTTDDRTQQELISRLASVEANAAKERLQAEQRRLKRIEELRKEGIDFYTQASLAASQSIIRNIGDEVGAIDQRNAALSISAAQIDQQRQSLNQQSTAQRTAIDLMGQFSQAALGQAKELENLNRLSKTDVGRTRFVREESQRQVKELTGKENLRDLRLPGLNVDQSLLVNRQQQEDAIAQSQAAALEAQLQQKRLGLQLDLESQAVARAKAAEEAKLAVLKAQQNQIQAQQNLFTAQLNVENLPSNASERDRLVAQNQLGNAQSQVRLADQGRGIAESGLEADKVAALMFKQLAQRLLQSSGSETQATKQLFNLKNEARERSQSLELAQQGIDPTKFNRRTGNVNLSDRTDPLIFTDSARSSAAPTQKIATGIDRLVYVGEQTLAQNRQVLSELLTIANRQPSVTPPQTLQLEPVLRGRGL